jgi:hypothetical protein
MPSILGKLLKRKTAAPNQFDAFYAQATSAAATQDFQRTIELYDQGNREISPSRFGLAKNPLRGNAFCFTARRAWATPCSFAGMQL